MSTAAPSKKTEKVSKKTEAKKNDPVKNEPVKKEAPSTTNTPDKKPQSASQMSISHFSSVSTPEYRKGWEHIFGAGKKTTVKNKTIRSDLPELLSLENKDIDTNLRDAIDKAFETITHRDGHDFQELKNLAKLRYI